MSAPLVVGVPGPWENGLALTEALLAEYGPRYLNAGQILLDVETERAVGLELDTHIPDLAEAFRFAASYSALSEEDFALISTHKSVAWLVEPDGGSVEKAQKLHALAVVLLKVGGLAVKVESAGKAHTAAEWMDFKPDALLPAFVTWAGDGKRFYSCGMHNFGMPDAVLLGTDPTKAGNVLSWFNAYLLHEQPTLTSGETFSTAPEETLYSMHHGVCADFPSPDDLFHNPHGVWTLKPV
jgi:hypothetical protein